MVILVGPAKLALVPDAVLNEGVPEALPITVLTTQFDWVEFSTWLEAGIEVIVRSVPVVSSTK